MATLTQNSHVASALRLLAASNKYIGVGRSTAWANESAPPSPDALATALEEPICYVPLTKATLVVQDNAGTLSFAGQTWREVANVDAYDEGAKRVYVEGRLEYDDAPLTTFRQVGLFTGLVKAGGAGAGVLLPAAVTSPGVLEVLDNRTPTYRTADKVDIIGFMVQF